MIAFLLAALLYGQIGESGQHWPAYVLHHPSGWPFYDSTGALVDSTVVRAARFRRVLLPGGAALERPAVAAAIRAENPNIEILAWVGAVVNGSFWQAVDLSDTLTNCLPLDHYRALSRIYRWQTPSKLYPGETYNPRRGIDPYSWCGTNWANHSVAYAWVQVLVRRVVRNPMFNGLFVDMPHYSILWSQNPRDSIDFRAAGFSSLAAFDSSWRANVLWAAMTLRRAAPAGFAIVFNGVNADLAPYAIAGMRENWPNLWGGSWESNMLGTGSNAPGDRGAFGDPYGEILNVLLCDVNGAPLPERARIMRLAVGSAALGTRMFACFTCINDAPPSDDRTRYWIPEMDVEVGEPYGPPYRWSGLWRCDFDLGYSWLVNPDAAMHAGVRPHDASLVRMVP